CSPTRVERRHHNGSVESLRGKLLIASPSMPDWFRRAVVLIVEHTEEGAFGLVLNRPSVATVGEAVPRLADIAGDEAMIHIGGPVQPDGVVALGQFEDLSASPRIVVGDVGLVDLEHPPGGLGRIRLYAGHSGCGPEQLDGEVEEEAWIIGEPTAGDAFDQGDLWAAALARMGGEYALLARMPVDPSVN
ncbi:MAG: YqgE/AlgH family protein, partial [Solirubrobacterales bacterium]